MGNKKQEDVVYVLIKKNSKDGAMPDNIWGLEKSFSAEDDIFYRDEQRHIAIGVGESSCFPEDWRNKNAKLGDSPTFINGKCTVKHNEKGKIMFMDLNNRNEAVKDKLGRDKTLYRRLNIQSQVDDIMKLAKTKKDASDKYWEMTKDQDTLRAVARSKGFYRNNDNDIYQMSLLRYVEQNPKEFLDFANNAQDMDGALRLDLIHKANEEGHIVYNQGRWYWKNSDVSIIAVPKAADAHDYLSGWTFSGSEGKIFWNGLYAKLTPSEKKTQKDVISLSREELKFLKGVKAEEIFETCKKEKVITFSQEFKQYQFNNGAETFDIGFSKNKAYEWINSEEDGVTDLRSRYIMAKKAEDLKE